MTTPYEIAFVTAPKPERAHLLLWLEKEWQYADGKFEEGRPEHDEEMRQTGVSQDGFWFNQVFQYARRAEILGLENPNGRQAIAKMWAAMGGLVESVIRVYGPLPPAGVPSGEIVKE